MEAVAAVLRRHGRLLLVRRPATGLLAGLWTLPGGELADGEEPAVVLPGRLQQRWGLEVTVGEPLGLVEHKFSHRRWRVHAYACDWAGGKPRTTRDEPARWVTVAGLSVYPLASLDRKLLRLALAPGGTEPGEQRTSRGPKTTRRRGREAAAAPRGPEPAAQQ